MNTPRLCWCGHTRETHLHYRPGLDCGKCGPEMCPAFSRAPTPGRLRKLFRTNTNNLKEKLK